MPSTMTAAASGMRGFSCIRGFHVPVVDSRTRRAAVLSLLLRLGAWVLKKGPCVSDPRAVSARAAHATRLPTAWHEHTHTA